MPTALFISPHLDDVAFSCGGTLIALADRGWTCVLATIFTASVPDPTGFALACQTDKGLPPDADYMALRRAEDQQFAAIAGIDTLVHLPLPEAPHRGYISASDLFAGVHNDDRISFNVAHDLIRLARDTAPDVLFAPQGLGNHVDHLHVIRAMTEADLIDRTCWYRDTPYAIRQPEAQPSPDLPADLRTHAIPIDATIDRKIAGCCAYTTQIGFQFGGSRKVDVKLRAFHAAEARRCDRSGYAEGLAVPASIDWAQVIDG